MSWNSEQAGSIPANWSGMGFSDMPVKFARVGHPGCSGRLWPKSDGAEVAVCSLCGRAVDFADLPPEKAAILASY